MCAAAWLGLELEHFLVGRQRLGLRGRILFQRDAAGEPDGGVVLLRTGLGSRNRRAGHNFFPSRKVHHELSRDRLQQPALMTERHAMLVGGGNSGIEQRISHARRLLLHGFERLPNHRRPHPHGAQVANFLDLQQVGKRVGGRGSNQPRALPVGQLARREMKNPK